MTGALRAVVLRPFVDADGPTLDALFADSETSRWNPGSFTDAASWMRTANADDATGLTRAVADPAGDRLLGTVSLFAIDRDQLTADIGYRVVPAERRCGVGSAAVLALSRHAFAEAGLVRVVLFHAVDNVGSCGVARRAGFVLEGVLRRSYRYGDGERHDEHVHARLADDPDPDTDWTESSTP